MPFGEIIRVALTSLRVNALRSLLTMLGVVIGVGAVITMVALGNGAQNAVKERIAKLGTTVLQINAARVNQGGVNTTNTVKMTMKDVEMMRDRSPHVSGVNQQQDRTLQIVWTNKNASVQVTGTGSNFLEVRGFRMAAGRMFNDNEDNARRRVAVIGADVLPLLGVDDPSRLIDGPIRIGGRQFIVIGVMAARGVAGVGDGDNQILIPFTTGRFEIFGSDRIQDIWARARDEASIDSATVELQAAIRRSHKLRFDQPDDFTIRNQSDFLVVLSESTQTFTALLAGISAVSLVVGGIGIMNIMLVSVTERTREIGIRKALGATRKTILLQFLAEAVVLCMVGGAGGVLAGAGASAVMRESMGWQTAMSFAAVAMAFSFAAVVGLVFGVWPARRASMLDPMEALRYD
ncbi:MAG: ABC transporter permease [Gemmatimonadaceae bacterium]